MKVSRLGDDHLLCLSAEEVDLLVDLCHAGAFSDHIATTAGRRQRLDALLWEMQQSLLPAVQKRYGRKAVRRSARP
ncbi:hypothetical protein [Synechococcus sp. GFB01]|jgi:hypothetical protein|uniref:hypothetical protein n=1 Tax=Synechococcus sp. GFB01 TaxID=1662190 RepID=UPI00064E304E|nr:hypothetical protein [Synechococcus sp. GFB01]KMM16461.1 hypothetical protein SYNGFB01_10675 [Synechococcus sp. GFB01]